MCFQARLGGELFLCEISVTVTERFNLSVGEIGENYKRKGFCTIIEEAISCIKIYGTSLDAGDCTYYSVFSRVLFSWHNTERNIAQQW